MREANTMTLGAAALLACAGAAVGQWTENFDTYSPGALGGQGGWAAWCSGGSDGSITTQQARSGPHAFRATLGTDMVQTYDNITSGQWIFSCWIYIPSSASGTGNLDGYLNIMNTYCVQPFVNSHWSTATTFNKLAGTVVPWFGATVPMVLDQWVEYRLEIDLDADLFKETYNGQTLIENRSWTGNVQAGGARQIRALDLFSQGLDGMFFDDISLQPATSGCYPDCDTSTGVGVLDIFDFLCFQNRYASSAAYACDCDTSTGSGVCDIFDFLCFQNAFAGGCP